MSWAGGRGAQNEAGQRKSGLALVGSREHSSCLMYRVSVPRVHRCDSLQARSADVPTHPGFLESFPGAIVLGKIPPANPLRQVERLVPIFLPSKGPGAGSQCLSFTATLVMEMKGIVAPMAMRQAKGHTGTGIYRHMPAHSIHMSDRIHTTFFLGLYLLVTPAPTTHLLSNTLGLPGSLTQHSLSY